MLEELPVGMCKNTKTHSAHEYIHYDIDTNMYVRMWCPGNILTVD